MKKDIEKSMMLVKGERFEKWHSGYYDITQRDKQKEKKKQKEGFLAKTFTLKMEERISTDYVMGARNNRKKKV